MENTIPPAGPVPATGEMTHRERARSLFAWIVASPSVPEAAALDELDKLLHEDNDRASRDMTIEPALYAMLYSLLQHGRHYRDTVAEVRAAFDAPPAPPVHKSPP